MLAVRGNALRALTPLSSLLRTSPRSFDARQFYRPDMVRPLSASAAPPSEDKPKGASALLRVCVCERVSLTHDRHRAVFLHLFFMPRRRATGSPCRNERVAVRASRVCAVEAPAPAQSSGFLSPQSCYASPSFRNRWLMVLPAFATHMCIGSPFAWSIISATLAREHGFVVSAARYAVVLACCGCHAHH
jgi:hypothetical protein